MNCFKLNRDRENRGSNIRVTPAAQSLNPADGAEGKADNAGSVSIVSDTQIYETGMLSGFNIVVPNGTGTSPHSVTPHPQSLESSLVNPKALPPPVQRLLGDPQTFIADLMALPEILSLQGFSRLVYSCLQGFNGGIASETVTQCLWRIQAKNIESSKLLSLIKTKQLVPFKEYLLHASQSEGLTTDDVLKWRDPTGATIVHIAYYLESYDIGHFLVEIFPSLALVGGADVAAAYPILNPKKSPFPVGFRMPYEGESVLHVAITRGLTLEVQWLLDFFCRRWATATAQEQTLVAAEKKLLFLQCRPCRPAYEHDPQCCCNNNNSHCYGRGCTASGTSLHLAASTGDTELFDVVLSYAQRALGVNAVFVQDDHGDTILHICVGRRLLVMSEYVIKRAKDTLTMRIKAFVSRLDAYKSKLQQKLKLDDNSTKTLNDNNAIVQIDGDREDYLYARFSLTAPQYGGDFSTQRSIPRVKEASMDDIIKCSGDSYTAAAIEQTVDNLIRKRLFYVINSDLLSPLVLAGMGNPQLLNSSHNKDRQSECEATKQCVSFAIASFHRSVISSRLPAVANRVTIPLEGVDTPYLRSRYDSNHWADHLLQQCPSLMGLIATQNLHSCFALPEIRYVVEHKWRTYGRRWFLTQLLFGFSVMIVITYLACFTQMYPNALQERFGIEDGAFSSTVLLIATGCLVGLWVGYHLLTVFASLYGFARDSCLMYAKYRGYRHNYPNSVLGATTRVHRVVSWLLICSFATFGGFKIWQWDAPSVAVTSDVYLGSTIALTFAVLSSYVYLYYYMIGLSDSTGKFVLVMTEVAVKNLSFFALVYAAVLFGFSCALGLLTLDSNASADHLYFGIENMIYIAWSLVKATVRMPTSSDAFYADLMPARADLNPWFDIIHTTFYIVVVLLLLNLLIAMIVDTYTKAYMDADAALCLQRYRILQEMDSAFQLFRIDSTDETAANQRCVSYFEKLSIVPTIAAAHTSKDAIIAVDNDVSKVSTIFELSAMQAIKPASSMSAQSSANNNSAISTHKGRDLDLALAIVTVQSQNYELSQFIAHLGISTPWDLAELATEEIQYIGRALSEVKRRKFFKIMSIASSKAERADLERAWATVSVATNFEHEAPLQMLMQKNFSTPSDLTKLSREELCFVGKGLKFVKRRQFWKAMMVTPTVAPQDVEAAFAIISSETSFLVAPLRLIFQLGVNLASDLEELTTEEIHAIGDSLQPEQCTAFLTAMGLIVPATVMATTTVNATVNGTETAI